MPQPAAKTPEASTSSAYPRIGLFIDGEWIYDRPSSNEIRNPSDESSLGSVPGATDEDLARALGSAAKGFHKWQNTPPQQRARLLQRVSALVHDRAESIARIITLEHGKPLAESRAEVARACTFLEWDAAEAVRTYGSIVPSEPQFQKLLLKKPIGPVAAFTPWNVPISSPARKISGTLAAGCSVIIKPAEETPGAACAFVQCFIDAGLPAGVLNLVFGDPARVSSTLIASPITRMVTLTGSVSVGKHLSQLAGAAMKPVLMELGGHAPVLICEDVDVAHVGRMAAAAKFRVAGQLCASPARFIVQESVYPDFVSAFVESVKGIHVGDGFAADVQMGPVANARRLAEMEALVADAKSCGARIAAGGHRLGERGYFFAPTVLADVPLRARVMTAEPFGPVGACVKVKSLDEAIALANNLSVGLSAYAFTNSLHDAERISRELEVGVLSINHFGAGDADTPFGGVKESGIGREGGASSLDAYMVTKTVLQRTARV